MQNKQHMKNKQAVEEICIKHAGKIARALNALSNPNMYPQCDRSYSFFSPFFTLNDEVGDFPNQGMLAHTLFDVMAYLVRKFARYTELCFHDIRVTFVKSSRSVSHSPVSFDGGYYRVDYVAIYEMKGVPNPVLEHEFEVGLYLHKGEYQMVHIDDDRGVNHGAHGGQLIVSPYYGPDFGQQGNCLQYFVDAEEIIPVAPFYALKKAIWQLTRTDKRSAAEMVFKHMQQSGVPLLPWVYVDQQKTFENETMFLFKKQAGEPLLNSDLEIKDTLLDINKDYKVEACMQQASCDTQRESPNAWMHTNIQHSQPEMKNGPIQQH